MDIEILCDMMYQTLFFRQLIFVFALVIYCLPSTAQPISLDEAVALALANHPVARNVTLAEKRDILQQKQAVEFLPIQAKYWQRNAYAGNDHLWSVTQDFGVIPEHIRKSKHYKTLSSANQAERELTLDELAWQVKAAYFDLVYYRERLKIMQEHSHYFEALISTAEIYLANDSIDDLTIVSAGSRYAAYQKRMYIAEEEIKRAENRLQTLIYTDEKPVVSQTELDLYQIHPEKTLDARFDPIKHKTIDEKQAEVTESAVALERSKLFPAIHAGYINQHISGVDNYQGWMVGLSFPLWIQPQRAKIKQAELDMQMAANERAYQQFTDQQHIETLKSLLNEYFVQISFSKENLLEEAKIILLQVEHDFAEARIKDYAATFSKVHDAISAKLNHLEYINNYNQTALELEYFTQ